MSLIKQELVPSEVVLQNTRLFSVSLENSRLAWAAQLGPVAAVRRSPQSAGVLSVLLKCFRRLHDGGLQLCAAALQFPVSIPQLSGNLNLKTLFWLNHFFFIDSKAGLNHTCFMILLKYLGLHQSQFVLFAISI